MGSNKKHKKHKKDKYDGERPPGLKLILKVGSSSTPEHSDSPGPMIHPTSYTVAPDDESTHSISSFHKKAKKKKKKKERDRDKHEKKKKHHHKEKRKRTHDESSQDGVSMGEDSLPDHPIRVKEEDLKQETINTDTIALNREPRVCVLLRQKQEKSPLQRMLEHLQKQLEKKDPQQFFAWPVTDQIAPGYSQTIPHPMDFSTMRQKIEENVYISLNAYISDLRLMCNNAMVYNHPDTIYYKAAKRLLHGGLKLVCPEKLRQLAPSIPGINQVTKDQLGFQLNSGQTPVEPMDEETSLPVEEVEEESCKEAVTPKRKTTSNLPEGKFEAIPDDLTSEQILEQAQKSASATAEKLSLKKPKTSMGFLRQQNDGSTSLAIFVPGEGVDPDRPRERSVSLGQLVGKLSHGSGQLQGFREDRRNVAKTVKPLNYGAFGSYAPSYDSTFANLSKEESDLLYETYGDDNATVYAESVLNFAKDCDYTLTMVDNLLDLLTGGEHRKTKSVIDEQRKFREEEERVRELMEAKITVTNSQSGNLKHDFFPVKVEIEQLKTLSDLGIDTSFLNDYEGVRETGIVQEKLDQTTVLLEKLQQVQNDRLSAPTPPHLTQILQPSDSELNLADKITESLTELAKQVPPGSIIPVPAIRKAMGIVPGTTSVSTATSTTPPTVQNSVELIDCIRIRRRAEQSLGEAKDCLLKGGYSNKVIPKRISRSVPAPSVVVLDGEESSADEETCVGVGQLDLESELREFLESDTALSSFPLHDDKTIEEMLSES